jgi:hypothetical protein
VRQGVLQGRVFPRGRPGRPGRTGEAAPPARSRAGRGRPLSSRPAQNCAR